ncbi:DNA methyltransferase [Pseudomonas chlororaphis]|uniref:DNA methyltransferase n=1 Tax=Pseudomonas chlororaphis TaxID=587753 RepID=UPI003B287044
MSQAQHEHQGAGVKPNLDPCIMARKPLVGTVAANVLAHGTGALNIDACRIPTGEALRTWSGGIPCRHDEHVPRTRSGEASAERRYIETGGTNFAMKPGPRGGAVAGRWPANLIHDGSTDVVALFPDAPGQQGASSDNQRTRANCYGALSHGGKQYTPRADSGSASRFFYCAKASRKDRSEGLPTGGQKAVSTNATMRQVEDADWKSRNGNHHPTVKPTDLMAYLCRLVTPPGGVVLDPFMGSGSTGKAAMREGFQFIGCELDPEYMAIAKARIEHELAKVTASRQQPTESQLSLFGS